MKGQMMKTRAWLAALLAAALCATTVGAMYASGPIGHPVDLDVASDPERENYSITAPQGATEVTVVARAEHPDAKVTVNGGDPDTPVQLKVGENVITVVVEAEDRRYRKTYTVTVTRLPASGEGNAALVAQLYQWRSDLDRALLALGETVPDTTLTAMTAAQAQAMADEAWETHWAAAAAAIRELENQAPTVSSAIGDSTIVHESGTQSVSLSGVFSDADSDALTITADSSNSAVATASVSSDGSTLTVSAHSRGTATITVTADDGNGGTVDDSFTVTVKAAPVVASAIADVSGLAVNATQDVSLSGVFRDADGDGLTITAASSNNAVATATVAADQSKLTLAGVAQGTATITVTAQDSDGNRVSDAFDVSVVPAPQPNTPPTVASAIADATIVNESGTMQVSLAGVFNDADSDALTITAGSDNEGVATASVSSDHSTLTVSAHSRGTATITVTAADGNGGTVADTFTLTVKAAPTVASAISDVSGLETGATRNLSLSGVFHDADNDSLTITAGSSNDAIATATVAADQSKLTLAGVSEGSATITVTARDTDGNAVSGAFDVSVTSAQQQQANRAPTVAAAIADAAIVNESGTQQITLSGVFSDADSDALTISAVSSNNAVATASVSSDHSTLTVSAQSRGTATITVTANDGNGGTVEDAFNVTVKAAPTVASPLADVSGLETGATRNLSLSGVFHDADGDSLTITAGSSNDAVATATVASDQSALTVEGVAEGTATITVMAQDADGNRVSDTFDVSVAPEEEEQEASDGAPTVVSPIADFGLEGPEQREIDLNQVFRDPDGQKLTFSLASSHYHVSTGWVDGSTLTVVGTGTGTATITVTAEDPDGNTVSDSFQVTVRPAS